MIKKIIKRMFSKLRGAYRAPLGYKLQSIRFGPNVVLAKKNAVSIGEYTFIGARVIIGPAPVTIGKYCSIGPEVLIGVNTHPVDNPSTSAFFYSFEWGRKIDRRTELNSLSVVIGSDVWIGTRAIVMPGIEIGHGAIIAAGSIVTKSVPPYTIVGGVPAKVIKQRFPEDLKRKLLQEGWWESPADLLVYDSFLRAYDGSDLVKKTP